VTWRWRVRHKLLLGLGLVVGIIALLLTGTLHGLLSYSSTMKSIDSKTAELKEAEVLRAAVRDLAAPADFNVSTAEARRGLDRKLRYALHALQTYEAKLEETLNRGRDPEKGEQERGLCGQMRENFQKLEQALNGFKPVVEPNSSSHRLIEDEVILVPVKKLIGESEQLVGTLYEDVYRRINDGKGHHKHSLIWVISTSVCGVLLMAVLLRFFYGWVFYPVRDLQEGARRVAQGDFEHRIDVRSGDEMEDLARAFNEMTCHLSDMYRNLEHQVNERSRQLVRSEHLASVGFLAAGVAHEINNPMASIAFCSEALERRLADLLGKVPQDAEVVTKYLGMIQKAAFRCKEITQRLLEFSRGGERRREPTDLGELVQNVLDLVEHLPNRKGKQVVFDPQERVVAWVNGQEINSVVLNLVVNALDSMDDGGVLTITLEEREQRAVLTFADTGCGMTAEVLENIFEPFFTRSRTGKGTGLGLSISHRIITQHGGDIAAVSPGRNQGSTFTVRLPLRAAEERGTRTERPAAAQAA
jgi:two-component system, NtrC family, sensor kinase